MKNKVLSFVTLIGLYGSAVAFQREVPPYPGDDNPSHNGQPMICLNYDTKEFTHNCSCAAMNNEDERCKSKDPENRDDYGMPHSGPYAPACKTRCRHDACECKRHCET